MYAIYGNIYHQYNPNVSIYSILDPMGDAPSMFPGSPADGRAALCSGPSLIFLVKWCHQVESLSFFLLEPSLKTWFQQ